MCGWAFYLSLCMNILIIGGGTMGATYARAFLRAHVATRQTLALLEKSPERAEELAREDMGRVYADPADCLPDADLVILAVKPQDVGVLLPLLRPQVAAGQLFLSIMAGITTETLSAGLGADKIVRAMPNLPAQIGMGMTAFTATAAVTRLELSMVQNLLATTGKTLYVEDEARLDAVTAISGSGPAYVFYFMEAMMQAAREMGFSPSEAELLVAQTFQGTAELYGKTEADCLTWIGRVASKGGTTEAALRSFAGTGLSSQIVAGARAALERAVELGK